MWILAKRSADLAVVNLSLARCLVGVCMVFLWWYLVLILVIMVSVLRVGLLDKGLVSWVSVGQMVVGLLDRLSIKFLGVRDIFQIKNAGRTRVA